MADEPLVSALATLDESWQRACQDLATSPLTARERLITTWSLLVAGAAIFESRQRELEHAEEALAMLRRLVRSALESRVPDHDTVWVIPHGPGEINRLAMYLVVAGLRMRDIDSRPWLWPAQPFTGRCLRCGPPPQGDHQHRAQMEQSQGQIDLALSRQAS